MSDEPSADLYQPGVSIDEAMKLAGVSRKTIYNWRKQGRIEYVCTPSGRPRILRESLIPKAPSEHGRDSG